MRIKAGVEASVDAYCWPGAIQPGWKKGEKTWQFPFALAAHDSTLLPTTHLRVIPTAAVVEKLSGERAYSRRLLPVIPSCVSRQYLRKGQFNPFSHSKRIARCPVKVDTSL